MKTKSYSFARVLFYALIISSLVLSLSPGMGPAALAQSPQPTDPGSGGSQTPPPPPHVTTDAETGLVRFMGGSKQAPLALTSAADAAAKSPREIAEGFLQAQGSVFGLSAGSGLNVLRETSAEDGAAFERFQQTYQGVPVLGGELIVQLDASKNVLSSSGQASNRLNLDVAPGLDAAAAQAAALAATRDEYPEVPADKLIPSTATLYVYDSMILDRVSAPLQKLVWQVTVATGPQVAKQPVLPVREYVLVDARTGEIVRQASMLDTALNRTIVDCDAGDCSWAYYYRTEDHYYWEDYSTDGTNAWDYLGDTYNFYKAHFGRDSINGKGMKLWAFFDYIPATESSFANAFWDGYEMVFGSGFVTDDVTGHELTHGVTQYESNLFYFDQSGAINESISDIFGEWIDQSNSGEANHGNDAAGVKWLMGEDLPGGPIRSMADPTIYSDPDRVGSASYYCGYSDEGGVHTNSGVGNKAAYLITDGGNFNFQSITGLGIDKAARIYYDVQANLLTSAAGYPDLADALDSSCSRLTGKYGITSDDCTNVHKAILATEMNQMPCLGARGYINPTSTFIYTPVGSVGTELHPNLIFRQRLDATAYQVRVKDSKGKAVYQEWLDNDAVTCPTAQCDATLVSPLPALKYGEHYSWAVQTRNPLGDGPWSLTKSFYTTVPLTTPPTITPIAPGSGDSVAISMPAFSWAPVDGATGYVLNITKRSPLSVYLPYLTMSLTPESSCPPGPTCTIQPSKPLVPGLYQWTVQAKFGTKIGDKLLFDLTVNPLPDIVTISAPDGTLGLDSLTPSATWSRDAKADGYIVTILGTAGKIVHTYLTGDCGLPDCTVSLPRLDGGKQTMTVQAFNGVGKGPVSAKRTFTINKPGLPMSLVAPGKDSSPDTSRPVFSWQENALATSYTLQVSGLTPFKKTYKASDICALSQCNAPAEVTFKQGGYTWFVTAINKAGTLASDKWGFTAPALRTAPQLPVLSSPHTGDLVASNVTLVLGWSGDTGSADEFIVSLTGPNHFSDRQILPTGVVCQAFPATSCSLTYLIKPLALGRYIWTVTASNHGVLSAPSKAFTFTLVLPAPEITAPVTSPQSLYQLSAAWKPLAKELNSNAYNVQLKNGLNQVVFNKTVLASLVCSQTTCTTLLPPGLAPDSYQLFVKGLHATGFGLPATSSFTFTPTFDAEFNTTAWDGWLEVGSTGHWYKPAKYLSNSGRDRDDAGWELVSNGISYTDLDVQFAVQRTGCTSCSTSIYLRGDVAPGTTGFTGGYLFNINAEGWFSVWGESATTEIALQRWTKSPLIHKGSSWNTLRVVTVGTQIQYYINGKLAWVGTDNSYGSGKVYLGMASVYLGDQLNIDWTRGYTAPSLAGSLGSVDPAQQILNQSANAQAVGGNSKYGPTYTGH